LNDVTDNPNQIFANKIMTDGSSVVFLFSRKAAHKRVATVDLDLTDFTQEEVNELFEPCAVDPGRTNAMTIAYGCGQDSHMLRNFTTKEYYNAVNSPASKKRLQQEKDTAGITPIETSLPTAKTVNITSYISHVEYLLQHLTDLYQFYGPSNGKEKYFRYKNTQKARSEAVSILVNGGKKYNRGKRKRKKRNRKSRKIKREKKKMKAAR
jgi:hypothetical protein